jgi:sec-independent protein translocase protein TatB
MFDIGFSEIFVIAIVALLVLGPERLPKAARFAGLWVRRARAQWYSVKSELENELADEDLKRSLRQTQQELREARDSLMQGGAALQRDFEEARTDVEAAFRDDRQEADERQDGSAPYNLDEPPLESTLEEWEEPPLLEDDELDAGHASTEQEPDARR